MDEKIIMLGNEAIARGVYEAGVKVSSAYPGTPSTEISEYPSAPPIPHGTAPAYVAPESNGRQ